jgi:catechol 2,3-dioxygenase-like lactoylglutathione lyase family enzyme
MKKLLLLTLIALPVLSGLAAQATAEPSFQSHGAFFAISVADLEASAKWYWDKFGLIIIKRLPKTKDQDMAVIVLEGGGLLVELLQSDLAVPLSKAAPAIKSTEHLHGITKAGLIVTNFDKTLERLRARGVPIKLGPFPANDPTGLRNFIIEDNSGNLIQFFGG